MGVFYKDCIQYECKYTVLVQLRFICVLACFTGRVTERWALGNEYDTSLHHQRNLASAGTSGSEGEREKVCVCLSETEQEEKGK